MRLNLNKMAAVIALIIGLQSVIVGARAMSGWQPGYSVINWLPVYNFIMGILTILITATLIWKNNRYAMPAAIATFSIHGIMLLLLLTVFSGAVASNSIRAMIIRLSVWVVILILMIIQSRRQASN